MEGHRISIAADNPDVPLAELVYRQLLEDIREGVFHPGERIKEASIAKRLGISRTPVREAIRRLQSEGRVTIEPQRGAVVAELNRMEISELYLLRQQLEGIAARFAAQHASDMEIEQMQLILERVHCEDADIRKLNQVNWDLHRVIFYAAKNRYLLKAFNAISDDLALLRGVRYIPKGRPQELYREHKAIVDAISARDPARAEQAAKDHIESSYRIHLNIAFDA